MLLQADSESSTLIDVEPTLQRARGALLAKQAPEGYWVGELQGDSILESEYLLLKWILGQEHEAELPLIANYLRNIQQPDGGWNLFPGGRRNLSGDGQRVFCAEIDGGCSQCAAHAAGAGIDPRDGGSGAV